MHTMVEHFELAQSSRSGLLKTDFDSSSCQVIKCGGWGRGSSAAELGNLETDSYKPTSDACCTQPPIKYIRFSTESLPDLEGPHLEVLSNLCSHPSEEFFVSNATGVFVRTSIASATGVKELCSPTLEEDKRCKLFSIHSNVLPCDPYWTKLRRATRDGASNREHFPCSLFKEACRDQKRLMTKLCEWRKCGKGCDIGQHALHRSRGRNIEKLFWDIQRLQVITGTLIDAGGHGDARLVKWRGGTFARKDRRGVGSVSDIELDVLKRLSHPHIVYGFGVMTNEGGARPSLFMEYMQNNLHRYAVRNAQGDEPRIKQPFKPEVSLDVLLQIARAMNYLHTNEELKVVHGDLKPQNVLISDFEILGEDRHVLVKVADFGGAQVIPEGENDFRPNEFGSTQYAAPELLFWRDNKETELRYPSKLDVYSFGAVAYEVLTGHAVHDGNLLNSIEKKEIIKGTLKISGSKEWKNLRQKAIYPLELFELVESCWELDPEKRPPFSQICKELEECMSKDPLEKRALWMFIATCICALICIVSISCIVRFVLESPRLPSAVSLVTLFLAVMIYKMIFGKVVH